MKGMIMVGVLSFCVLWGNAQQILTLDECQDIAVENNKQGKLSDYSIQKAQLQVSNMNSNFLPKFSAVGGYLYANKDFGMELMPSLAAKLNLNNIYVGGVQLEQPLFLGGKLVAARKMAKMGLTIANLNKDKTDSDIRFEAEKAYWNVVKAKELLKVAEQYVETVDELYRTVENLYRTGMVSQNELLKVKVKVNETKLTRRRTENAVRLAKMSLCHQMGWPLDKEIDVANDLSDVSPSFDKIAYSLENRLEYKILSENINLKGQEVKAVRSEYLPRVGLVAGYNYMNGVKLNDNKLISDDLFAVMLSVKIPLFHWGEGARKIKSAKIERQIAEIQTAKSPKLHTREELLYLFGQCPANRGQGTIHRILLHLHFSLHFLFPLSSLKRNSCSMYGHRKNRQSGTTLCLSSSLQHLLPPKLRHLCL